MNTHPEPSYAKLLRVASGNENHNDNTIANNEDDHDEEGRVILPGGSRLAFGASQEDADLALARILQEQENAYMMLARMEHAGAGGARDAPIVIADDDDDQEDGETHFDDDEAFARALQAEEVRAQTERLLSLSRVGSGSSGALSSDYGSYDRYPEDDREAPGMDHHGHEEDEEGEHYNDIEDDDEEEHNDIDDDDEGDAFDPDNMTYEELMALGEAVGAAPRGASAAVINALPQSVFASTSTRRRSLSMLSSTMSSTSTSSSSAACLPQCVICQSKYADGERLCTLPCAHDYHTDCIHQWLAINKVCPMCNREVSAPAA